MNYQDGQTVELGDIVDVSSGDGLQMEVVVIIESGRALEGFDALEWAYLRRGVILRDQKVFGLLHLEELDHEVQLVHAA